MADASELETESFLQNAKTSNDLWRLTGQMIVLINGGAATAVLGYSSTIAKVTNDAPAILYFVPYALGGYAVGVLCGAVMILFFAHCVEYWMEYHYYTVKKKSQATKSAKEKAEWWYNVCRGAFIASASCFIISSSLLAFGLYLSLPARQ
jgi:hypothetical protein